MSGSYQLSLPNSSTMQLFSVNPLTKRWQSTRIATGGQREPIFAAFWQLEMNFSILQTRGESDFFMSRFVAGGLYNARLPHPITGALVGFTGVSIEDVSFSFGEVDSDGWTEDGYTVRLGVNLYATGSV